MIGLSQYLNTWCINQFTKVGYVVAGDSSLEENAHILKRLRSNLIVPKEELKKLRDKQMKEFNTFIDTPNHSMVDFSKMNDKHRKQLLKLHNKWLKKSGKSVIGVEEQKIKDIE